MVQFSQYKHKRISMEGSQNFEVRKASSVEQAKKVAFEGVLGSLDSKISEGVFESYETPEDYIVAEAQKIQDASEQLLSETVEQNDYRKEQAIAKFNEFAQSYKDLVRRFAELKSSYPEATERIEHIIPSLSGLSRRGEELRATYH